MAKIIAVEVDVTTKQAQDNIDELNKSFDASTDYVLDLEKELLALEKQLDKTPKKQLAAQKELRDRIEKTKNSINQEKLALKEIKNERQKYNNIIKENADVQSDLTDEVTKNGGAMAILNQLTGGLAQQFKDSYEAIQLSSKGLKGFRAALVATGIGAAVVAVGLLYENWDKVKTVLTGVTEEQKKYNEAQTEALISAQDSTQLLRTYSEIVLDTSKSENARKKALEELKKIMPELNGYELESVGLLEDLKYRTDLYTEAIENRAKAEAFAKIIAEEQANIIREQSKDLTENLTTWDYVKAAIAGFGQTGVQAASLVQSGLEKQNEKVAKSTELISKLQAEYDKLIVKALEGESQLGESTRGITEKVVTETKGIVTGANTEIKANVLTSSEQITKTADKTTEATEKVTTDSLGTLAGVIGQNSKFGKALAVANAIRSTYEGASKAIGQGGIFGPIAAGAVIAAGLSNVKQIVATQDPPAPSFAKVSGGSTYSMPSVSKQIPQISTVGTSGINQLAQTIAGQSQQPIKAYVVSSDVTSAQSLDRNKIETAGI